MSQEGGVQDRADDRRDFELLYVWSPQEVDEHARYEADRQEHGAVTVADA